jgi:type I restriction enzyme R subunit
MDKKKLTERDICTKFINPAIGKSGWDLMRQVLEEHYFTDGRIIVRGKMYKRGKGKKADYILFYKQDIPIAVIEAKDNNHSIGAGMQQALEYAEILQVPFAFSSNGDGFILHDRTAGTGKIETELSLDEFPSPEELWRRYTNDIKVDTPEALEVVEQDYYSDDSGMHPRYYQQNAVNRTIEAIAKGQDRILLVMATGTGKTYTAFNIIWRLWKANKKKRILFLADRNALLTQTKNGDFSPFGNDIMHIIKNRKIDKSYQIYFALYQGLTGTEEFQNIFKEFSPDFFDLIIIDECHRGSASEASAWRDVLTYFSSATQIGLTATPKETKDISNMEYFGQPVYTYSLKQGIEDGFLAPYKVIRITTDIDEGWRPTEGLVDKYGHEVEDRIYNLKDYDRNLVIDEYTEIAAQKITEYLKGYDRFAKTIVFCEDIDHADRMRHALINQNADLVSKHPYYVVKITGDDEVGKRELDNFTDVEERFPVIATTSKMLTTGIDTKMAKLIVLVRNIRSMTEFKQIIGRGTRIREADGKVFFSIMDFKKATNLFADPDFDGDPVQIYDPKLGEPPVPPDPDPEPGPDGGDEGGPDGPWTPVPPSGEGPILEPPVGPLGPGGVDQPRKFYVKDVPVSVVNERVQYYDAAKGKLITESLTDYSRKNIKERYGDLDTFLSRWSSAEKKQEIIDELLEQGVFFEELEEKVGKEMDAFDLICHVAFDKPPLTRKERADNVRKRNYFAKYGEAAQKILQSLLTKYEDEGISSIEEGSVLNVKPLNEIGSPVELVKAFGKKDDFDAAIRGLEQELYKSA